MSNNFRTLIVDAITARLLSLYGPSGSVATWFREVDRKPLRPGGASKTRAKVMDGGQRGVEPIDNESSARVLRVRIVLEIEANWERVGDNQTWSDRVEYIIHKFENWLPNGFGVYKNEYKTDDPMDLVFANGTSEAVWIIDFDYFYTVETQAQGQWTES